MRLAGESKEAAAEAEVATFRADADEVGAAIAGLAAEGGAGEDSALFPPSATRRVTLREELIDWAMKRGSRRGATEGSGKARWVSNSRNAVLVECGVVGCRRLRKRNAPSILPSSLSFHRPSSLPCPRCFPVSILE